MEFFATQATAQFIQEKKLKKQVKWRIFQRGARFAFRDLEVATLQIPHDAYDPVGYRFECGAGDLFNPRRALAWITDLGHIPQGMAEFVRDVHFLVLESNHDPDLLEQDMKRPFSTKQRIRGRHGHLSNPNALEFLRSIRAPKWRQLALGHLSKDCNCPQLVAELHRREGVGIPVEVVHPSGQSRDYRLGFDL